MSLLRERVNIVSSGSKGNAVIYNSNILVDCGVPYALLKDYVKYLSIILLTHRHRDHYNQYTIKRIIQERPSIRIACGAWFKEEGLSYIPYRNIDILHFNKIYDYGNFQVSMFKLYHDVPNCGWRIFLKENDIKIFHATDTAHLKGIRARDYDIYAIEANYDEDTIEESIEEQIKRGEYAYQIGSINSHLSEQQANDFYYRNCKSPDSPLIILHEHSII